MRGSEVIRLYWEGAPIYEILKYTGIDGTVLFNVLKNSNILLREGFRLSLKEAEVIRLYKDEYNSIIDIMESTGIGSRQTICAILKWNGIKIRRVGDEDAYI
jgi:hypothetical protein